jgi:hypothetical protein
LKGSGRLLVGSSLSLGLGATVSVGCMFGSGPDSGSGRARIWSSVTFSSVVVVRSSSGKKPLAIWPSHFSFCSPFGSCFSFFLYLDSCSFQVEARRYLIHNTRICFACAKGKKCNYLFRGSQGNRNTSPVRCTGAEVSSRSYM